MRFTALLAAGAAAFLLTACAGVRQIDADVESAAVAAPAASAGAAALAGAHYRFEQLPLQAGQPGTARVQALAQQAALESGGRARRAGARRTGAR